MLDTTQPASLSPRERKREMWAVVCYPPQAVALTTQINNAQHRTITTLTQLGYLYFGNLPKLLNSSSTSPTSLMCSSSTSYEAEQGPGEEINNLPLTEECQQSENKGLWNQWKEKSSEMSSKLGKLGLSAVLAYGIFDAVTYTSFFVLAFLGYEKSTGQNPAANLKALIGIVILMWTGNNVTRPFRVAGAAALAPFIDKGLKKIQKYFNFPSLFNAFALVVGIVAAPCLGIISVLILSRWGK